MAGAAHPAPASAVANRTVAIVPIGYYVVVELLGQSVTEGGIILPEAAKKDSKWARVRAVGEGEYQNGVLCEIPLKVGDLVALGPGRGVEFAVKRRKLIAVNWREVLCAIRDGETEGVLPEGEETAAV